MLDNSGEIEPGQTLRLEGPPQPWWFRPVAATFILSLALSLLLAAFVATWGLYRAGIERSELKQQLAIAEAADNRDAAAEQAREDCRNKREDQVLLLTSRIVGTTADLFSELAPGGDQEKLLALVAEGDALHVQRDAADAALGTATEDCRNASIPESTPPSTAPG